MMTHQPLRHWGTRSPIQAGDQALPGLARRRRTYPPPGVERAVLTHLTGDRGARCLDDCSAALLSGPPATSPPRKASSLGAASPMSLPPAPPAPTAPAAPLEAGSRATGPCYPPRESEGGDVRGGLPRAARHADAERTPPQHPGPPRSPRAFLVHPAASTPIIAPMLANRQSLLDCLATRGPAIAGQHWAVLTAEALLARFSPPLPRVFPGLLRDAEGRSAPRWASPRTPPPSFTPPPSACGPACLGAQSLRAS